jgi:hypothetical protein
MDLDLGPGIIIDPTADDKNFIVGASNPAGQVEYDALGLAIQTVGASSLVGQVEYDALALAIQKPVIISIQFGQEWNNSTLE